jgi:hypothetical protein
VTVAFSPRRLLAVALVLLAVPTGIGFAIASLTAPPPAAAQLSGNAAVLAALGRIEAQTRRSADATRSIVKTLGDGGKRKSLVGITDKGFNDLYTAITTLCLVTGGEYGTGCPKYAR